MPAGKPAPRASQPPAAPGAVPRPWVLGEIAVEGNKNMKAVVVRSQVKARKGDLYDRPDLDRDIQSLLGLGNFERVAADVSLTDKPVPAHFAKVAGADRMVRLTFLVKEKPLVKKVKFSGNKKVSRSALEDATALKAKDPLDENKLRDDQEKILAKYHEKGFLDATTRYEVARDTAALQSEITWIVSEGPKSHIEAVAIAGVKACKPQKLMSLMKNRTKGWFRAGVFTEKELPDDVKKIEDFYHNHGYLDVVVSTPAVAVSTDKTRVYLTMSVLEGRAYKFGDTTFSGNLIYTSTELAKALEYRRGKVFNQEKFDASLHSIQELYADKGRLRARVSPVKTFNRQTALMDVGLAIVEGNIVYIHHVYVEGNKVTKAYVFKREVTVKPGQAFSLSRIRKSRERIMNLGFIDDVDVDIQPTPDPDKVDLAFDVTEGKPGMLTAGAAYSSIDGLIGTLSLQHMNLFGRAQRASLQWSFGKRVQDYSASWSTPWVKDKPVTQTILVGNAVTSNSSQVYAMQQGGAYAFTIAKDDLAKLEPGLDELRSKKLFTLAEGDVGRMIFDLRGATTDVVADTGGKWSYPGNPAIKLDQGEVNRVRGELLALKATKFIDAPTTPGATGFEQPFLRLTAVSKDGKTSQTVITGRTAGSNDFIFARVEHGGQVVGLDMNDPKKFYLTHDQFLDKQLFAFDESLVEKVQVKEALRTITFTSQPGGAWAGKAEGAAKDFQVEPAKMSSLIFSISNLAWSRRLDARAPADEAAIKENKIESPEREIALLDGEGKELARLGQAGEKNEMTFVRRGAQDYFGVENVKYNTVKSSLEEVLKGAVETGAVDKGAAAKDAPVKKMAPINIAPAKKAN